MSTFKLSGQHLTFQIQPINVGVVNIFGGFVPVHDSLFLINYESEMNLTNYRYYISIPYAAGKGIYYEMLPLPGETVILHCTSASTAQYYTFINCCKYLSPRLDNTGNNIFVRYRSM